MPDYSKSIIYKICSRDITIKEIYIGSTSNDLRRRKWEHKSLCNNDNLESYNRYVYQFIRQNGGWCNFDMVMIEEYPCDNKTQLHSRERYWIEELNASLNKSIPTRQRKEYNICCKEKIRKQLKEYSKIHKQEIKDYKSQNYYCSTCDKNMIFGSKSNHNKSKKHINKVNLQQITI